MALESDLYRPVQQHLEALGYIVRGEVGRCDIVGLNGDIMVAVELKLVFGLPVLYQALRRMPAVDLVYVAIAAPLGRQARANWVARIPDAVRLCRRLGIGLLSVRDDAVEVHADPMPYQPRRQPKARARLLSEFVRRTGDHNLGGSTRLKLVTAYREEALDIVRVLARSGAMRVSAVRDATGLAKAGAILGHDVYGWFRKVARGTYEVAPAGLRALEQYAGVVAAHASSAK